MKKILFAILMISRLAAISQTAPTSSNLKGISTPGNFGSGYIFGTEYKNTNTNGAAGILTTVGATTGSGRSTVWGTTITGQGYIWNSKGVILPQLSTINRSAITTPSEGTTIFNTTTKALNYYAGLSSGWQAVGSSVTGTPTRIPYFDSNENLTFDGTFYRDSTNGITIITSQNGDTTAGLIIFPFYGAVQILAEDTVAAKSSSIAAIIGSISMVNESPDADTRIDMGDYSMAFSATSSFANQERNRIILDTTQITFVNGEKFGFQNNYSFPTDTGSVGQVLAVTTNDGSGNTTLNWQTPAALPTYTVATLPVGTVGMIAYVTDATVPTFLGALVGGGAVTCPVFYNGAAWVSY